MVFEWYHSANCTQLVLRVLNSSLSFLFVADKSDNRRGFLFLYPISSKVWRAVHSRKLFSVLGDHFSYLPAYQPEAVWPFFSDLWHQQGILAQGTAAHWLFLSLFFFLIFLCKHQRCLCEGKIPVDQHFLKYSNQSIWHQQPRHVQSPLNHLSSPLCFDLHQAITIMPTCLNALNCCHVTNW